MTLVFCIDGVVVDIGDHEVTRDELEYQLFMPIERQPIMAGVLAHKGISLLSPDTGAALIDAIGGHMVEDINTETFADVSEALDPNTATDWPIP